jgi:orotate phosphoribosyltransferase
MKSPELLNSLLKINSIKINLKNPFNWASGWKSPIYFDNRISLSYPKIRTEITERLKEIINENYKDVDSIAGVATAGIPQGALVSSELELPFSYVRSKPKSHGMENLIEGRLEENKNIILIEDLISTGGSSIKAVEAIRDAGSNVLAVLSIFNYGFNVSTENFNKIKCNAESIFYYRDLLEVALANKYISENELVKLKSWRENPGEWK